MAQESATWPVLFGAGVGELVGVGPANLVGAGVGELVGVGIGEQLGSDVGELISAGAETLPKVAQRR